MKGLKDKGRQVVSVEGKHVFLGCCAHLLNPASAAVKGFLQSKGMGS